MTAYLPFDPDPRTPAFTPPPNSCDSQFHVFGSRDKYPVRAGAAYEMPSATIAAALKMHRTLGIARGVIVQPTTYGADHSAVLDALAVAGPGYRGCANAVVFEQANDADLAKLDAAGVRGARFTRQGLGVALKPEDLSRALARTAELGWYVKVQPEPAGIPASAHLFESVSGSLVIDHMGRPGPGGVNDPVVIKMLELLARGNVWVMLSLAEKTSRSGPPWDDVVPIARAYIAAAPDRVIWGSDWPHPLSTKQPPNDADLLEFIHRCAPDAATLERILVTNPARLFGF